MDVLGFDVPVPSGDSVQDFIEDSVCGKLDVYFSGHDHNLQWLEPTCGTHFIVSGAGATAESLPGSNPTYFQEGGTTGFTWVQIEDDMFTAVFFDKAGVELFAKTITK